jgi:hypothetical protein
MVQPVSADGLDLSARSGWEAYRARILDETRDVPTLALVYTARAGGAWASSWSPRSTIISALADAWAADARRRADGQSNREGGRTSTEGPRG